MYIIADVTRYTYNMYNIEFNGQTELIESDQSFFCMSKVLLSEYM